MAATEFEILRDEQERGCLLSSIAAIEAEIAVATPGTRRILENTVENARKRVTTLDKKIDEAKVERAAEVQTQAATTAALAAKETRLNASEREAYRGFLEESYFTKKDFGRLDEFYVHGYDRLSEGGKEEMSKRIDEGIKRGEFKFEDLPKNALEKETKHRAVRTDKRAATQAESIQHTELSNRTTQPTEIKADDKIDVGSIDLSGIKLTDASESPAASNLPNISNSQGRSR